MDTSNLSKDELAVLISKTLWSKGDIDLTQEPLTFSHWLWGHIPIPKDKFLQRDHKILKYQKIDLWYKTMGQCILTCMESISDFDSPMEANISIWQEDTSICSW